MTPIDMNLLIDDYAETRNPHIKKLIVDAYAKQIAETNRLYAELNESTKAIERNNEKLRGFLAELKAINKAK